MKLLGRADLGPTSSDLEKLMQDGRHSYKDLENASKILEEDHGIRESYMIIQHGTTWCSIVNELKLYQLSGLR